MGHIQDRWYRPKRDRDSGKIVVNDRGRPVLEKTERFGVGDRYRVRYIGPDGREKTKSFPDRAKKQADDYLSEVEAQLRRGSYVDPEAGRIGFRQFARRWLDGQSFDETSRETAERKLNSMIFPYFADRPMNSFRASDIRGWVRWMQQRKSANSYQAVCFAHVSAIFTAAVDDKIVTENPCHARSVTRPKPDVRKVVPWSRAQVRAAHLAVPDRWKATVPVGAGLGLRQGEIFAFGTDQIDRDDLMLRVTRQLREVRGQLVFALPKRGKTRDVPLSRGLLRLLDEHMDHHPPVAVTLPWREPDGPLTTVFLVFTDPDGKPLRRRWFNRKIWHPARAAAGIATPTREDGMHALRHHYASVLLDAGESIKALSEYLGHTDPGFTLRTYTHLMPSSAERTRTAIDREWNLESASDRAA